jgi:hypothetical protein
MFSRSPSPDSSSSSSQTPQNSRKRKITTQSNKKTKKRKKKNDGDDDGDDGGGGGGGGGNNGAIDRQMNPTMIDPCFLCEYGNNFLDAIRVPHIHKLREIMDEYYGSVRNYDLAQFIHKYYMDYVYDASGDGEILHVHVILEHLEGRHDLSFKNFLVESIRDIKQIQFIAKNSIFRIDGTIDSKAYAIYKDCQRELRMLYTMNPKKMNFNQGNVIRDLSHIGVYFHLPSMSEKQEEKQDRIKRKRLTAASHIKANSFDM